MVQGKSQESFTAYTDYNKTLRSWLVVFGIGAPAAFIINPGLAKYITPETGRPGIFLLFLLGAGAQVVMAFANKTINWCSYWTSDKSEQEDKKWTIRLAERIARFSSYYIIDFLCDLITIACFGFALGWLYLLVTNC